MEINAMEGDWFELPDQGSGEWSWDIGNSYDPGTFFRIFVRKKRY